jgi:Protein of unknown function, DUF417
MRSFRSWRSQVFSLKTSTITSSARRWCYLPGLWLPEMVRLRGAGSDSVYQQWPADFLAVSRLRYPRGQLVSRRLRMAVRRPTLPGILEQATGNLGSYRVDCHVCRTVTIIPFMPNGWDPVAGFPAMAGNVPFLMKDVVLLAVSIYLLKQDVVRVLEAGPRTSVAPLEA